MSNDIGSFLGPPPGNPQDDSDLYARWVQLGTFQPVLRLHSSAGNRLPWDLPGADRLGASPPASCGCARHSIHAAPWPTLASEHRPADHAGAVPRLPRRAAWLTPTRANTCTVPTCSSPRRQHRATSPPSGYGSRPDSGRTGSPAPRSSSRPPRRSRFRSTGCRCSSRRAASSPSRRRWIKSAPILSAPLTLRVYPGASPASFTLYQDAGSGTGYMKGQSSLTSITINPAPTRARSPPGAAAPAQPGPSFGWAGRVGSVRHRGHRPELRSGYPGQAGDPQLRRRHRRRPKPSRRRRSCSTGSRRARRLDLRSGDPYRGDGRHRSGKQGKRPDHRGGRHCRYPGRSRPLSA